MRRLKTHPERGATTVLVAGLMTALLGVTGLAIDLGASYAKKSELQNGADAAALALAQEYAVEGCTPDSGLATTWVQSNVKSDPFSAEATATCPASNQVSVEAAAVQQHWFLPVIGKQSSDVSAVATVAWGVPLTGTAALPMTFSECSFTKRVDGVDVPINGTITIWMDHPSDPFGDACNEAYPPGGFGWLQPSGSTCEAEVTLWPGGDYGKAPSKPGTPQPDQCADGKEFRAAVDSDEPILIPIFDQVSGGGSGASYRIMKFAAFQLRGYDIHNKVGKYGASCGAKPSSELKSCLVGEFVEYVDFAEGMELAPPGPSDETIIIKLIG